MELICLSTTKGNVNLAESIGVHYDVFGILLLEDAEGNLVSAMEEELGRNSTKINRRIFQLWLQGKGKRPVSWDTLVSVLKDTGLNKLASDVIDAKC